MLSLRSFLSRRRRSRLPSVLVLLLGRLLTTRSGGATGSAPAGPRSSRLAVHIGCLLSLVGLGIAAGSTSLAAQPMTAADSGAPAGGTVGSSLGGDVPGPCSSGVVRDDGSAEGAWGWVPSVVDGRYVQEFELAEFPTHNIETFCVCWRRTREDTDLDFEVVFFQHDRVVDEDDGSIDWVPQMDPYAVVPASASGITDQVEGTWVEVDVGSVEPPLGQFFSVGVRWNPSVDQFFFICGDKSPETPRSNVWFIDDRAEGWTSVLNTIDPIFVDHRAFLMRAAEGPVLPTVVDVPSLSRWGLGTLATVLLLVALTVHRRR